MSAWRVLRRFLKSIISRYFYLNQWIIFVGASKGYQALTWSGFKPLFPSRDRFWADPFVWQQDGKTYVFIEELLYSTNLGRIACLTLDQKMNVLSNKTVLERPYHLSYPFLFEQDGQLYMMPETAQNNGIEIYRCVKFPDQWEYEKTIMRDVYAVDSTLLNSNGKWWLFTNIKKEGGSSWDALYLFYADHPLSEDWTPHPLNPIVKDIHTARPAGRIFLQESSLIRPSQDCSARYGYAVNFNRIVSLSETDYAEVCEHTFKPPENGRILATHTYNDAAGLTTLDAVVRRYLF